MGFVKLAIVSAKEKLGFGAGAAGAEGVVTFPSDDFFESVCCVCCAAFCAAMEVPGFFEADFRLENSDDGFGTTWLILIFAEGLLEDEVGAVALLSVLAGWAPLLVATAFFAVEAGDGFDDEAASVGFFVAGTAGGRLSRGRFTPLTGSGAGPLPIAELEVAVFDAVTTPVPVFPFAFCFESAAALSSTFCARPLIFSLLLLSSFGNTLSSFVFSSSAVSTVVHRVMS